MNTGRQILNGFGERVSALVCVARGHNWAGARHHAAQSDGLLLCVRCGYEDAGDVREPVARLA